MQNKVPRVLGQGYQVPDKVRKNSDPIFDWLKKNNPNGLNLFKGYKYRRVLSKKETLMSVMVPAAQKALAEASIKASQIDILLGTASMSPYRTPNALSELHRNLGLPSRAWPIPVQNDFSNFNSSILIADALIRTKQIKYALICVGGNWTRGVNYHTPQSISAADGAGAIVMGPSRDESKWKLQGFKTLTDTTFYGTMFSQGVPYELTPPYMGNEEIFSKTYFQITDKGLKGFKSFGAKTVPKVALALMKEQGLSGKDITLISHQASSVLMKAWKKVIQPAQYINSIKQFANMTVANVPVNFAWATEKEPIRKKHLLLLTIGVDMHANAMILKRG